jgi:rhodanese-related sulfurtransferase
MKHLLLALLLAFAASGFAAEFADISKDDLSAAIAAKTVVLIDVNGSESYNAGHIPGAIDFQAKQADLAKLLPADKGALIVAYCGGPACGAWQAGAEAVAKLGYTNVKHFKQGISGWKQSGAPVETVH